MATNGNGKRTTVAQLDRRVEEQDRRVTDMAQGFTAMLTAMSVDRPGLARKLGLSYEGLRDLYKALGWKEKPGYQDYLNSYRRDPVAKAVVDAPVRASWRPNPRIRDAEEDDTQFETEIADLFKERRAFHYMSRVDRLSSIGTHAVMLLGFNDRRPPATLAEPLGKADDLLFIQVFSQENAVVDQWDTDATSERFGMPEMYKLNMQNVGGQRTGTAAAQVDVHWSRVIHVAEDKLESDVYGTPGLESVFNMLQSLEIVAGCSAEFFYRGAFMGLAAVAHEGAKFGKQSSAELKDELQKYQMDLQRILTVKGANIEQLKPLMESPKEYVEVYKDLIAAAKRFPKRKLFGSERGELASTQDDLAWSSRIGERREEHCEPTILGPTVDRLIEAGVVTPPSEAGWTAEWEPVHQPTEQEQAERATTISTGLKSWIESGGEEFIALKIMMEEWGFSKEQIERNEQIIEEMREELDAKRDEAEAAAIREAEAAAARTPPGTPPPGAPADAAEAA